MSVHQGENTKIKRTMIITLSLSGGGAERVVSVLAISSYYNEAWVRPNLFETPKDNEKVEGGSYW